MHCPVTKVTEVMLWVSKEPTCVRAGTEMLYLLWFWLWRVDALAALFGQVEQLGSSVVAHTEGFLLASTSPTP